MTQDMINLGECSGGTRKKVGKGFYLCQLDPVN